MITSKLTSKARTTIPRPVRAALRLREGDVLSYRIEGARVILAKALAVQAEEYPFGAFAEWNSEVDRRGYADF